ncbi:MAG: OmpA family protein [Pseudomonadota bacterium]
MRVNANRPSAIALLATLALVVPGSVAAQDPVPVPADNEGEVLTTVYGSPPADLSGLEEGPDIEGFIGAREGDTLQIMGGDGAGTDVRISPGTDIRSSSGLFGINRTSLSADELLNGLPVKVRTVQWNGGLVASRIRFTKDDLETAELVRNGTSQRFAKNETAISENAAATEALRGRVGDIDQYNIKGTTNVYFDTGKYNLSAEAGGELCNAAAQAEAMDNAVLLVVGYTDSTGSYEVNQELSDKRAGRVVNYLQQQCGWKPYRMLTPTGLATSDPAADNSTAYGKAQNRRVAVNILVSKGLDGI